MGGKRQATQRRAFIRTGLLAAGGVGALAMQGRLGLVRAALAAGNSYAFDDYRSLVCVYLDGGNDAFNMFVPYASSSYAEYAGIRRRMAIPRQALLPVRDGRHGFHPAMPGLRDLYDSGSLGVVSTEVFSAIVLMVIVTTFATPPWLTALFANEASTGDVEPVRVEADD